MLPGLGQHLDRHIIRYAVLFYKSSCESELGLRCGGESYLYLLEADTHEHIEELQLFVEAHGLDERLVAVS